MFPRAKTAVSSLVLLVLALMLTSIPSSAVELTIWSFQGQHFPDEVLRAFEEAHPGVTVVQQFPAGDFRGERFLVSSVAGVPPDLIHLNLDFLPMYVLNDLIEPLTPYIEAGKFGPMDVYFPGTVTPYEGEIYFIPHRQSVNTMLYNRLLFEHSGLDPDNPPVTWDDFRSVARRLTVSDGGQVTQVGAGLRTSTSTLTSWFQPMLWQAGGELLTDGRVTINNEAGRDALSFYVEAIREGYGVEGDSLFRQGKAGMLWQGWSVYINNRRHEIIDFVDVGPVLEHRQRVGYGSLAGWVVPKGPNTELAIELLAFTLQPENVEAFLALSGFLPVRRDIGLEYFGPEDQHWVIKFIPQQPYIRFDILHPEIRTLQPMLAQHLIKAVRESLPVDQVLAEAERLANVHIVESGW